MTTSGPLECDLAGLEASRPRRPETEPIQAREVTPEPLPEPPPPVPGPWSDPLPPTIPKSPGDSETWPFPPPIPELEPVPDEPVPTAGANKRWAGTEYARDF